MVTIVVIVVISVIKCYKNKEKSKLISSEQHSQFNVLLIEKSRIELIVIESPQVNVNKISPVSNEFN